MIYAYAQLIIRRRRVIEPIPGCKLKAVPPQYREEVIEYLKDLGYDKYGNYVH